MGTAVPWTHCIVAQGCGDGFGGCRAVVAMMGGDSVGVSGNVVAAICSQLPSVFNTNSSGHVSHAAPTQGAVQVHVQESVPASISTLPWLQRTVAQSVTGACSETTHVAVTHINTSAIVNPIDLLREQGITV